MALRHHRGKSKERRRRQGRSKPSPRCTSRMTPGGAQRRVGPRSKASPSVGPAFNEHNTVPSITLFASTISNGPPSVAAEEQALSPITHTRLRQHGSNPVLHPQLSKAIWPEPAGVRATSAAYRKAASRLMASPLQNAFCRDQAQRVPVRSLMGRPSRCATTPRPDRRVSRAPGRVTLCSLSCSRHQRSSMGGSPRSTSAPAPRLGRQALPYESPCVSRCAPATEACDVAVIALETTTAVVVAGSPGLRARIAAGTRRDVAVSGPTVPNAVAQDALARSDVWTARTRTARGQGAAHRQGEGCDRPPSRHHGLRELRAWGSPSRSNLLRNGVDLGVKAAGNAARARSPLHAANPCATY
jgi:hypothetical protein